jgi:hypothetical protein
VFSKYKVHKQYADYLYSAPRWLINARKFHMIPLTSRVALIHEHCTVLHSCEMVGKERRAGAKVTRISHSQITRGYVVGDVFWFLEGSDDEEVWKGVSLRLEMLGEAIDGERPPEPTYHSSALEVYSRMFTVRHEATREMLWVGVLRISGKAHVLGTHPY